MPIDPNSPPVEPRSAFWASRIGWAALLIGLASVLNVAVQLLRLAVPETDDLSRAGAARTIGVLPYLKDLYHHWSGRWSGVGLALVVGKFDAYRNLYPWALAGTLLTLPIAVYALLSAMFEERLARRTRALLSLGLVVIHWSGNPQLQDSYYWLTGAFENYLPLSCGLFIIAGLIRAGRQAPSWWMIAGLAALAVFSAGLHELYGIYLGATLVIGTMLVYWTGGPERRAWTVVTVAGLGGLAINLFAPGHTHRLDFNSPTHDLAGLMSLSREWANVAYHWIADPKLLLATVLIVCHPQAAAACPDWLRRRRTGWTVAAAVATIGVLASATAVNWWTTQGVLPGHTRSAIYLLFLAGWFLTTYAAGTAPLLITQAGQPLWAAVAVCFACSLVRGETYRVTSDDLRGGRAGAFHEQVKARDRLIRSAVAAGDRDPGVPPITCLSRCFLFSEVVDDSEHSRFGYVNASYCAFYGLHSIHLRRDPPPIGPTARAAGTGPVGR